MPRSAARLRRSLQSVALVAATLLAPLTAAAELAIDFIDIGQGDATYIHADGHHVLIDGGTPRHDAADYLRARGVDHIDLLVATHPHADHIGGQIGVLQRKSVGEIWYSGYEHSTQTFETWLDAALDSNARYREPTRGHTQQLGQMRLTLLHPGVETPNRTPHDRNLVVRIDRGPCSAIIAGDIEVSGEREIIASGLNLRADVLDLGHHGSHTSSSQAWLRAVSPQIVVAQYGVGNRYGHPHTSVVERVRATGVPLLGTGAHGTIRLRCGADGQWQVRTERRGTVTPGDLDRDRDSAAAAPEPAGCIDLNRASARELERITHIGSDRAQAIIDRRPWSSVEELNRIDGIGPGRLRDILQQGEACVER
ncbi:MBL fold metallo-hydrolase [Halorhodospira abdelmalekii]|uniref:MBL fold metallo-hydrolase n=1 Tax=Halorhodospira abdelmalekii TaxID=421629 RepID=UPI001A92DBE3